MSRTSTLTKRLQPMLATLTDAPFDDPGWVFEDKYDGFRMIAEIRRGKVALYSRNGKIISRSYIEVAKALEGVKGDAVIDGELVAIGQDGVSHFQLLQNALRHEAKLLYCAFDLMFENAADLRKQPLLERKKRLKAILPRDKLIDIARYVLERIGHADRVGAVLVGAVPGADFRVLLVVYDGQADGARQMIFSVLALAARIDDERVLSIERVPQHR